MVAQRCIELRGLLKKQSDKLKFSEFKNAGNDLLRLEEARKRFSSVRKLLLD